MIVGNNPQVLTILLGNKAAWFMTDPGLVNLRHELYRSTSAAFLEVPPQHLQVLDYQVRSEFSNVMSFFRDLAWEQVCPFSFWLANATIALKTGQPDYFTRQIALAHTVSPSVFGLQSLTSIETGQLWVERSAKGVVGMLKKAANVCRQDLEKLWPTHQDEVDLGDLAWGLPRIEALLQSLCYQPDQASDLHRTALAAIQNALARGDDDCRFRLFLPDQVFDQVIAEIVAKQKSSQGAEEPSFQARWYGDSYVSKGAGRRRYYPLPAQDFLELFDPQGSQKFPAAQVYRETVRAHEEKLVGKSPKRRRVRAGKRRRETRLPKIITFAAVGLTTEVRGGKDHQGNRHPLANFSIEAQLAPESALRSLWLTRTRYGRHLSHRLGLELG